MSDLSMLSKQTTQIKIGERSFKIGKLTIGDYADFQEHLKEKRRDNIIENAKKVYPDGLPDTILDKVLEPMTDKEIDAEMGTISGMGFLLYKMLSRHQEVTLEDILSGLTVDDLDKLTSVISPAEKKRKRKPVKNQAKKK